MMKSCDKKLSMEVKQLIMDSIQFTIDGSLKKSLINIEKNIKNFSK